MKKKQKINKAVNYGEWVLLGLTALFLCVLFALRDRPAPERGVTASRPPSALPPAVPSTEPAPDVLGTESGAAVPDTESASAVPGTESVSAVPDTEPAPVAHDIESTSAAPDTTPDSVSGRVNINTADLATLCALPGIGESLAGRVIAYREEHGPFSRPEDIMNVSGIGQGKFAAIQGLITAE